MSKAKTRTTIAVVAALVIIGGGVVFALSGSDDGQDRKAAIGETTTTGYSVADLTVVEENQSFRNVTVRINRTGTISTAGSVKLSTLDGTAKSAGTPATGADYVAVTGVSVAFAANVASATTTVRIYGDTLTETDETIFTTLSAPVGSPIADGVGTITIPNDDEGAALDGFAIRDFSVGETSGTVNIPIFRYGATTASASVTVQSVDVTAVGCAGDPACDYKPIMPTVVSFAAGQALATVPVTILSDSNLEGDETFDLTLSSPVGAAIDPDFDAATGMIVSRTTQQAGFDIGDAVLVEGNSGNTTMTFTIVRRGPANGYAKVKWSTAVGTANATDFVAVPATQVTFADGETTKTVTVSIVGDATAEANETLKVNLSRVDLGLLDPSAVGTIVNDD